MVKRGCAGGRKPARRQWWPWLEWERKCSEQPPLLGNDERHYRQIWEQTDSEEEMGLQAHYIQPNKPNAVVVSKEVQLLM